MYCWNHVPEGKQREACFRRVAQNYGACMDSCKDIPALARPSRRLF
jgi:hypothetical protein